MFDMHPSKSKSYVAIKHETESKPAKFWLSYSDYRLILFAWMLNDISIAWATSELAHSGFYNYSPIYFGTVILIGGPLFFSEMAIVQYTNCDAISLWDMFPIFRGFGYGSVYSMLLKTIYMFVLSSWFLIYTVDAISDPQPWATCKEFSAKGISCMVKKKNISIFQNCLEAQVLWGRDCGLKTASWCHFQNEIGERVTKTWPDCLPLRLQVLAHCSIAFGLFILTLKPKFLRMGVKLLICFLFMGVFVLVCVSLSMKGTWFTSTEFFGWTDFDMQSFYLMITKSFLSMGTATGMIPFLTQGTGFRSPCNMTSIAVPLVAVFVTQMLSLVVYCGIKTMSYYHGDEDRVVEFDDNYFFSTFASVSEVMLYFSEFSIGLLWFSVMFFCMFVNAWLMLTHLKELLVENCLLARRHVKSSSFLLIVTLAGLSYPCFCSDLATAMIDAINTIQICNSLMLSVTIYWIYGFRNHSVDIMFMIGVKSNYFWKVCWLINPLLVLFILISQNLTLTVLEFVENGYKIEGLGVGVDYLLCFTLIGIYFLIVFIAMFMQAAKYISSGNCKGLFTQSEHWGPKDLILFKSRKMFVPEIMTREFLYRQAKSQGYGKGKKIFAEESFTESETKHFEQSTEWSVLTSN